MLKKIILPGGTGLAWWQDPIFMGALLLAVILHLAILTLHFAMPDPEAAASKEIAVSIRPSSEQVKDADYLAQAAGFRPLPRGSPYLKPATGQFTTTKCG